MSRKVLLVLSDHPDAASMVKLAAQDLYKTGRCIGSIFMRWLHKGMSRLGRGTVCRKSGFGQCQVLSAANLFRGTAWATHALSWTS